MRPSWPSFGQGVTWTKGLKPHPWTSSSEFSLGHCPDKTHAPVFPFWKLRPCFACPNKCSSWRVIMQNQKGKAPFSPPQAFVAAVFFCDITTGLKIMAYKQNMSSQNGNLSGQKFHVPVKLTSNAHSHSWTNRIKPTLTCKSKILSLCKNTNKKFHKDLAFFPIHFDWSEMKL